jgi:hypothetical protein
MLRPSGGRRASLLPLSGGGELVAVELEDG